MKSFRLLRAFNNPTAQLPRPTCFRSIAVLAFGLLLPLYSSLAVSEQKNSAVDPDNAAWKQLMALSKPDENHQRMADLVGSWTYITREVQFDGAQGQTIMLEAKGSAVRKSLWGGRYFLVELASEKTPTPWLGNHDYEFRAMLIEGYDAAKKKFFIACINNGLETGLPIDEGEYDAATKTLNYEGEMDDGAGKKIQILTAIKLIDKDHYSATMKMSNGFGTETEYVRVGAK